MTAGGTEPTCPRCGSPMVARRKRSSGEPFLGCSRFPECRGTRPSTGSSGDGPDSGSAKTTRYRLSLGGRPRGIGDYAELVVARFVGRDLNKREGCLVQAVAILAFIGLLYWFVASGLMVDLAKVFADWYSHQITLPGAPRPTPAP